MRGILTADPSAQFRFWGGDGMASVGGAENLCLHYKESSFFGFVEIARNIGTISRQLKKCKTDIEEFAPDVVILIDYPGFNLKIARFAHEKGIKVHYYIAPKVWASRESRLSAMKQYIDELFIIFPFERGYFSSKGIEAHFMGNPLVDALAARVPTLPVREEFIKHNKLSDKPIVALLAGSRKSEIKANLPLMTKVARAFPDYQFVVGGVSWIDKSEYDKHLSDSPIRYVKDQTYELLNISEAALVTSGTATLETALLNIPEVVLYRLPWLHNLLKGFFLKIPYISLVNINLERESVKEILQSSMNPQVGIDSLRKILKGGSERERMLNDFAELRTLIGGAGASERFAKKMVEIISK